MPTVFVVNPTNDDVSAAKKFGDLYHINHRYIFPDDLDPQQTGVKMVPKSFIHNMREAVRGFNPACDYLLIVGDHLQLIAFVAQLVAEYYTMSGFAVLRYDRETGEYIPVWVPVPS